MNKLKTDYPCNLKLWLVYFVTIYADKKGLNIILRNVFSFFYRLLVLTFPSQRSLSWSYR